MGEGVPTYASCLVWPHVLNKPVLKGHIKKQKTDLFNVATLEGGTQRSSELRQLPKFVCRGILKKY